MSKRLPHEDCCTGCGACADICSASAISMAENADGFLMPVIDNVRCQACGKCFATCPVLTPSAPNMKTPAIYAFRADDATRMGSSSGGFFPVAAKKILDAGGVVCGTIYGSDWRPRHVIADDWAGIQPMRGAKYAQSDTGGIYAQAASILRTGRQLLFTGTPCQGAALKSFLGKEYANLLTIDIVCEGVPSQSLFRQHLSEINFPGPYKSMDFRSKHYPWGMHVLRIEAQDGRLYEGRPDDDNYVRALLSGMSLRKSCIDCPFCAYPRQGDISMGDLWDYDKIMGHEADEKGTSMLFINNAKGWEFFKSLHKQDVEIIPVKWNQNKIPNRVYRSAHYHPGRDRFFHLLRKKSLHQAIDYVENKKFDAGCVGVYDSYNFGSTLTYFALYHVLEDLGMATLMIVPYNESATAEDRLKETYEAGSWPNYVFGGTFANKNEMRMLNERCEIFVSGSDQLFNGLCYQWTDGFITQDWVEDSKIKIAYAASFGHDKIITLSNAEKDNLAYAISKFDAFSVREESGVDLCQREFGLQTTHVLDPVFLCAKTHYDELASLTPEQNPPDAKFVYAYILDPTNEKQDLLEDVCNTQGVDYRLYSDWNRTDGFRLRVRKGKMNKRLHDLMCSKFIIADSFHGVCFAIIFRKPFIIYANHDRGYARFASILRESGLTHRMVHSFAEYQSRKDELLQPVDYDGVYLRLQPHIDFSMNWLKNTVNKPVRKKLSDYDASMRKMLQIEKKLEDRCRRLEVALAERDKRIDELMHVNAELIENIRKG